MRALIFGAGGQDGFYLDALCRAKGIEPIATSRQSCAKRVDVAQYAQVEELVKDCRPAYIFHLAACSNTRHESLLQNHGAIATGAVNVLEAARKYCPESRIFITGSGLQFVNTGAPISESAPFEANSAYSMARIEGVYAARYFRQLGLRVYVGYLFHHESPHRKPHHVSKSISLAVRRIAAGSKELIHIGDPSVRKEWTFAGDTIKGIWSLVNQNDMFEAAIGSGITHSIQEWIEQCFQVIGKDWREYVDVPQAGFSSEYKCLQSDPTTIRSIGWRPQVDLSELANFMVRSEV